MGDGDKTIRELIREELQDWIDSVPQEPELISVEEAAKLCGVSKSVIYGLAKDAATNSFPSVRLGTKIIHIDKRRLSRWIQAGGLAE